MSKTADLRKLVGTVLTFALLTHLDVKSYYRHATHTAAHPYVTFSLSRIDPIDPLSEGRFDYELTVDVWDHATDSKAVDDIADELEERMPGRWVNEDILTTFYRSARYPVEDTDKDIQHEQLTFQVVLYKTT